MNLQFRLSKIDSPSTYWKDCDIENLEAAVMAEIASYGVAKKYLNKIFFRENPKDQHPIEYMLPADLNIILARIKEKFFIN